MHVVFRPAMGAADLTYLSLGRRHEVNVSMLFLAVLEHEPERRAIEDALQRLTTTVPRLRQRIAATSAWTARWTAAGEVSVGDHLRDIPLGGGDLNAALAHLPSVLDTPFDADKPPWQAFHFRDAAHGRSFLAFRLHHCMGDGRTYLAAFQQAFGDTESRLTAREAHDRNLRSVAQRACATAVAAGRAIAATLTHHGRTALNDERRIWAPSPPPGRPDRARRGQRIALWSTSLTHWRRSAQTLGGGHNELFLLIAAYAESHYNGWPDRRCMMIMPISTRIEDRRGQYGEQDGSIALATGVLSLDRDDVRTGRLARIAEVAQSARADATRTPPRPPVVPDLMRLLPERARSRLHLRLFARSDVVASNVGRVGRLRIAGSNVSEFTTVSPAVACPLALTTVTYDDRVLLVASIDPGIVTDTADVVGSVDAALARFVPDAVRRGGQPPASSR